MLKAVVIKNGICCLKGSDIYKGFFKKRGTIFQNLWHVCDDNNKNFGDFPISIFLLLILSA